MPEHDVSAIESQIHTLRKRLERFVDESDWEELLRHLRQPGWTTPAEFILVASVVHVLNEQVHTLTTLKTNLLAGSREIVAAAAGSAAEAA